MPGITLHDPTVSPLPAASTETRKGRAACASAAAVSACAALFVCTDMVYASDRFLREWASPLTLVNYTLLGCASGFTLATPLATSLAPALIRPYAQGALLFTLLGAASRLASLRRNAQLKPKSTLQTALGIKHPRIEQKSQGFMGGTFNMREFFHGKSALFLRKVKWLFLALAFAIQYAGLLAERWFFLAQANHPQNMYYQAIS